MPNRLSSIGAFSATDRPWPRTLRVSTGSIIPSSHSLALAAGSNASGGSLFYGRAGDSVGDAWPDGIAQLLTEGYGGYCDLRLVNGVPAMCFYSFTGSKLWYMEAADATGTSWNDPYIVASSGIIGEYCSMTVIDFDRPIIFFYDSTNDNLLAAYWIP